MGEIEKTAELRDGGESVIADFAAGRVLEAFIFYFFLF